MKHSPTLCIPSPRAQVGIVIEGGALNACLTEPNQAAFMDMCRECRAVVCCRVSPMQKAQVGGRDASLGHPACAASLLPPACPGHTKPAGGKRRFLISTGPTSTHHSWRQHQPQSGTPVSGVTAPCPCVTGPALASPTPAAR